MRKSLLLFVFLLFPIRGYSLEILTSPNQLPKADCDLYKSAIFSEFIVVSDIENINALEWKDTDDFSGGLNTEITLQNPDFLKDDGTTPHHNTVSVLLYNTEEDKRIYDILTTTTPILFLSMRKDEKNSINGETYLKLLEPHACSVIEKTKENIEIIGLALENKAKALLEYQKVNFSKIPYVKEVESLILKLSSDQPEVRNQSITKIIAYGDKAVPILVNNLDFLLHKNKEFNKVCVPVQTLGMKVQNSMNCFYPKDTFTLVDLILRTSLIYDENIIYNGNSEYSLLNTVNNWKYLLMENKDLFY